MDTMDEGAPTGDWTEKVFKPLDVKQCQWLASPCRSLAVAGSVYCEEHEAEIARVTEPEETQTRVDLPVYTGPIARPRVAHESLLAGTVKHVELEGPHGGAVLTSAEAGAAVHSGVLSIYEKLCAFEGCHGLRKIGWEICEQHAAAAEQGERDESLIGINQWMNRNYPEKWATLDSIQKTTVAAKLRRAGISADWRGILDRATIDNLTGAIKFWAPGEIPPQPPTDEEIHSACDQRFKITMEELDRAKDSLGFRDAALHEVQEMLEKRGRKVQKIRRQRDSARRAYENVSRHLGKAKAELRQALEAASISKAPVCVTHDFRERIIPGWPVTPIVCKACGEMDWESVLAQLANWADSLIRPGAVAVAKIRTGQEQREKHRKV